MVLIYATHITPRLEYITSFLFGELYGLPCSVTNSADQYNAFEGLQLNYSHSQQRGLHIKPGSDLVFQNTIQPQHIETGIYENLPTLFPVMDSDWQFDIFAASFYLLSRYEEYLHFEADDLGRYKYENSFAYKHAFLQTPIIQYWMQAWITSLQQKFPQLHQKIRQSEFRYTPTYDIDMAYSYLHKGWLRNTGGLMRDLLNGKNVKERIKVLSGKTSDPFDSFEWLDEQHMAAGVEPHYFVLLAQNTGKLDKNISPQHPAMEKLIKHISSKYAVGIHPSWQSGDKHTLLSNEIKTLQTMTNRDVLSSRQHYIRLRFPDTYSNLLQNGILQDFSMGYPDTEGFRASVAAPFFWFNLQTNTATQLQIFPFACMDATAYYHQHLTANDTLLLWQKYYHTVKAVSGHLITIAHNTFYGKKPALFKGWKNNYQTVLKSFK